MVSSILYFNFLYSSKCLFFFGEGISREISIFLNFSLLIFPIPEQFFPKEFGIGKFVIVGFWSQLWP